LISRAIPIALMALLSIGKAKNKILFGTELMIFLLLHLAFFTIPSFSAISIIGASLLLFPVFNLIFPHFSSPLFFYGF